MNKILNITIGVLVLSLAALGLVAVSSGGAQPVAQPVTHTEQAGHQAGTWHAVWYYTPQSVQEAYGIGTVAVVGTVQSLAQAPDIVVPAKGEPDGVDRQPNQTITFSVDKVLKGSVDKSINLFHVGDATRWADDDPAYAVGEKYVLFMLPREDGRYVLVAPEGRYKVVDGRVEVISQFPNVAAATGTRLDVFLARLQNTISSK